LVLLLKKRVARFKSADVHHKGDEYATSMSSQQQQQLDEHYQHEPKYFTGDEEEK